jgi:hypothetical protein
VAHHQLRYVKNLRFTKGQIDELRAKVRPHPLPSRVLEKDATFLCFSPITVSCGATCVEHAPKQRCPVGHLGICSGLHVCCVS